MSHAVVNAILRGILSTQSVVATTASWGGLSLASSNAMAATLVGGRPQRDVGLWVTSMKRTLCVDEARQEVAMEVLGFGHAT